MINPTLSVDEFIAEVLSEKALALKPGSGRLGLRLDSLHYTKRGFVHIMRDVAAHQADHITLGPADGKVCAAI